MKFFISLRSELLKTKRSAVWLSILILSAIIPIFMLLVIREYHDGELSDQVAIIRKDAWNFYFKQGAAMIGFTLLPIYVVLISTLLPQIEYRNQTWKQVFAAPQSYGRIYLSKFIVLQLFILVFLIAHSLFMGGSALLSAIFNPKFEFSANHLDWANMIVTLAQCYVAVLGLSALQFWLGLRFKSFILPIGIGILCSVLGIINMIGYPVINADKYFFNYTGYIFIANNAPKIPLILWSSVAYTGLFFLFGLLDFSRTKSR
jgi:hypothetical protein